MRTYGDEELGICGFDHEFLDVARVNHKNTFEI